MKNICFVIHCSFLRNGWWWSFQSCASSIPRFLLFSKCKLLGEMAVLKRNPFTISAGQLFSQKTSLNRILSTASSITLVCQRVPSWRLLKNPASIILKILILRKNTRQNNRCQLLKTLPPEPLRNQTSWSWLRSSPKGKRAVVQVNFRCPKVRQSRTSHLGPNISTDDYQRN